MTAHPLHHTDRGPGGPTQRSGEFRRLVAFARSRPGFLCGLVIVAITMFLALFGPTVAP